MQVVVADVWDFSSSAGSAVRATLASDAAATLLVLNKVDLLPTDPKKVERRRVAWVRAQPDYVMPLRQFLDSQNAVRVWVRARMCVCARAHLGRYVHADRDSAQQ